MNLSRHGRVTRVVDGAVAGTGTTNGSSVDMNGFGAVTFVFLIGAITEGGTVTCKAQQSDDDGSADSFADLADSAIALENAADDDKVAVLEINEPRERYVRPVIVRADENAVIDGVIAVQTAPKTEPVTHDEDTVKGTVFLQAPSEGTA